MLRTHKDLEAWKNSMNLVTLIYEVTKLFPKEEIYGLTNQIRRSAVSIPSNIAEGMARNSDKEKIQFLFVSIGSLSELETQLMISNNLSILKTEKLQEFIDRINHIRAQIHGLIKYLNADKQRGENSGV